MFAENKQSVVRLSNKKISFQLGAKIKPWY